MYTMLLLYIKDEYYKSIWLSFCLLTVLHVGLQGTCTVVRHTVTIFFGMVSFEGCIGAET